MVPCLGVSQQHLMVEDHIPLQRGRDFETSYDVVAVRPL